MSVFSLMIVEGLSVSCHALETSSFKISLNISSIDYLFLKMKKKRFFYLSLHISPIVSICWDAFCILQSV